MEITLKLDPAAVNIIAGALKRVDPTRMFTGLLVNYIETELKKQAEQYQAQNKEGKADKNNESPK